MPTTISLKDSPRKAGSTALIFLYLTGDDCDYGRDFLKYTPHAVKVVDKDYEGKTHASPDYDGEIVAVHEHFLNMKEQPCQRWKVIIPVRYLSTLWLEAHWEVPSHAYIQFCDGIRKLSWFESCEFEMKYSMLTHTSPLWRFCPICGARMVTIRNAYSWGFENVQMRCTRDSDESLSWLTDDAYLELLRLDDTSLDCLFEMVGAMIEERDGNPLRVDRTYDRVEQLVLLLSEHQLNALEMYINTMRCKQCTD